MAAPVVAHTPAWAVLRPPPRHRSVCRIWCTDETHDGCNPHGASPTLLRCAEGCGAMEPQHPQHNQGASSMSEDGAGPGPSSLAAMQGAAEPTGLLDALQPLLAWAPLGRAERRALRQACRAARLAVDAAVRSLDLRQHPGGSGGNPMPELRRLLERMRGLRGLKTEAQHALEVLGRVGVVEGAGERLRSVTVSFTAAPCSIGPGLSMLLRAACPNLEVSQTWGPMDFHPTLNHTSSASAHTGSAQLPVGQHPGLLGRTSKLSSEQHICPYHHSPCELNSTTQGSANGPVPQGPPQSTQGSVGTPPGGRKGGAKDGATLGNACVPPEATRPHHYRVTEKRKMNATLATASGARVQGMGHETTGN
jgi:hypothetical protein